MVDRSARELADASTLSTTFTYILCKVVRMSRAESTWWAVSIGVADKTQYLQRSWAVPNNSKHTEASFSVMLTDTLYL